MGILNVVKLEECIVRLNLMLQWSDRIGSDEIDEIKTTIKILKDECSRISKNYRGNSRLP